MESNVAIDGQDSWEGGVHAGVSAKLLRPNQCAAAINTRFRGGQPHPRCPVYLKTLASNDSEVLSWYRAEIYQGGLYYNRPDGDYMVHVVGGRVFVLEDMGAYWFVRNVTPDSTGLSRYASIVYLCQADKYVIIQDGEHVPIVVNGLSAFRAGGKNPIPIGGVMAYVNGRLWLARGPELLAGDLVGSSDDAVLKFSEALYLNEGGSFKAPNAFGDIVSLDGIASQDTATGQGTLIVGCEFGAFSINGLVSRDQWKSVPIQQITLIGIGFTSNRGTCNVNGDLWFPSHDGWRSYRQARAEIQGWNQVPLSTQVQQYINAETAQFRQYISAVYWDNRLLVTTGPTVNNNRPSNFGLLSLDFHVLSTGFEGATAPAWDGYWTLPGNVCELLSGVFAGKKRCFAVCIVGGQNQLYELARSGCADNDVTPIQWELDTRKYFYSPKDARLKKITYGGDLRLSNRIGTTTTELQFRQDNSSAWKFWQSFTETGQTPVCTPQDGCAVPCPTEYYSPHDTLGTPSDSIDGIGARFDGDFYDLQCKIRVMGYLQIDSLRLQAAVERDKDEKPTI